MSVADILNADNFTQRYEKFPFGNSLVDHTYSENRKRSDSVLWQKPLYQHKCHRGKLTTQNARRFDYTAIADRLRTVSWSNYSYRTGVVNNHMLHLYRKKFRFPLFHMVYTYCYFNSNLIKIFVKESVTDIMKHPVYNYVNWLSWKNQLI